MAFHDEGQIFSIPPTVERFIGMKWLKVKTPLENFYITVSDASTHGIVGAMMGGFVSASLSLGMKGFFKVGKAVNEFKK